jgi:hypothetical protein
MAEAREYLLYIHRKLTTYGLSLTKTQASAGSMFGMLAQARGVLALLLQ